MKTTLALLTMVATMSALPAFAADTLYADMGGQPVIDRLADAAMDNYLADDRIKAIFDESNIDRIRAEKNPPLQLLGVVLSMFDRKTAASLDVG